MCKGMPLSDFKDIFGRPGEGVHAHRVLGLATVDLAATAAVALLLARIPVDTARPFNDGYAYRAVVLFAGLMVAAVFIHRAFGVRTALNEALFGGQ
jgi:hypothetical protein